MARAAANLAVATAAAQKKRIERWQVRKRKMVLQECGANHKRERTKQRIAIFDGDTPHTPGTSHHRTASTPSRSATHRRTKSVNTETGKRTRTFIHIHTLQTYAVTHQKTRVPQRNNSHERTNKPASTRCLVCRLSPVVRPVLPTVVRRRRNSVVFCTNKIIYHKSRPK